MSSAIRPVQGLGSASRPNSAQTPLGPIPTVDLDLFLARHATQGFTQEVLEDIQTFAGGHRAWLDNQLGLAGTLPDPDLDAILADPTYEDLFKTPAELFVKYGPMGTNSVNELVRLFQGAQVVRSVFTKRQLFERIVEFWTDHLNVWVNKDSSTKLFKVVEDDSVIRPNALGKFKDLLRASAQSAAMLRYLNGDQNVAGAPNENYAREVMELHTLGVDVLYDEDDVAAAAKLFTGWTFNGLPSSPSFGAFFFNAANHSTENPITVLGVDYTSGDVTDGEAFLDDLASRPETAEFVCSKLILWLLGNPLPPAKHANVVNEYLASDGNIATIVREIFSDANMIAAAGTGPGFKRPSRIVSGLLRQTLADLGPLGQGALAALRGLRTMGQLPYDWPAPTGYPISKQAWGTDVFGRWTFSNELLQGILAGLGASVPDAVIDSLIVGAGDLSTLRNRIEALLMGGRMDNPDRLELRDHLLSLFVNLPSSTLAERRVLVRDAIVFAASLPSYQFD